MPIRDIVQWLLSNAEFQNKLERLTVDTVCAEFEDSLSRADEWKNLKHDWSHLLLAGSILAQSHEGPGQAAALRIAQACLTNRDTSRARHDSAAILLDALSNHPAISLAIRRQLIEDGIQERLPVAAQIEWLFRELDNSVVLSNSTVLHVNRFQRNFWEGISTSDWLSVSAPTSAGKSFIVAKWIGEVVHKQPKATIVYLVPTRALISEVERSIRAFLNEQNLTQISVSSLPLQRVISPNGGNVLVYTQERLQILLSIVGHLKVDALVVDEAHKVGDKQRGVLLQQVIERLVADNPGIKIVFASPMTSNPGLLLEDASATTKTSSLLSEDVTVNQNLVWVSQVRMYPTSWQMKLCLKGKPVDLGRIELPSKPDTTTKRLSFVAYAIGGNRPGNIIYVNGAAEAEKVAAQLYDLIGEKNTIDDKRIEDLVDLSERIIHREFALAVVLRRGIAFHYGNLPLLIRTEVENLFRDGIIRYLVCTSTLIEGVNMACRSIYLRGPKKGKTTPMTQEDFWNLAGRAGRWGQEFQGNVICVDSDRTDVWGDDGPPSIRIRYPMHRTTDSVLAADQDLLTYIRNTSTGAQAAPSPELETVFSYLVTLHYRYGSVKNSPWANRIEARIVQPIADEVERAVNALRLPLEIVERNPGIDPFAMASVLTTMRESPLPIESFVPLDPSDSDAYQTLRRIFDLLAVRMSPKLGPPPKRSAMLAFTVFRWMRGYRLSSLIKDRIKYQEEIGNSDSTANIIRAVMEEVEQIARFEAPRSLSCYCDLLSVRLREVDRLDLAENIPDFGLLLELGVGQQTQVSLISVGLSRTSAIELSEIITSDKMSESDVLDWLVANRQVWEQADLPALVKREVNTVLSLNNRNEA